MGVCRSGAIRGGRSRTRFPLHLACACGRVAASLDRGRFAERRRLSHQLACMFGARAGDGCDARRQDPTSSETETPAWPSSGSWAQASAGSVLDHAGLHALRRDGRPGGSAPHSPHRHVESGHVERSGDRGRTLALALLAPYFAGAGVPSGMVGNCGGDPFCRLPLAAARYCRCRIVTCWNSTLA